MIDINKFTLRLARFSFKINTEIHKLIFVFQKCTDKIIKTNITTETIKKRKEEYELSKRKNLNISFLYNEIIVKTDISEYKKEIQFLKELDKIVVFPYAFINEYSEKDVNIHFDFNLQMYYVIYNHKKLFFPGDYSEEAVRRKYVQLLIEADKQSPHSYYSDSFFLDNNNSIFFDVGAAEGITTLRVIEKVKKAYVFEGDKHWRKALRATFKPYASKVEIIDKMVSDRTENNYVKLDDFENLIGNNNVFIKIDVEGMELDVLNGTQKLINKHKVKCSCCTYHHQNDFNVIETYFKDKGYTTVASNGVMLFPNNEQVYPYFRIGVLYASNY